MLALEDALDPRQLEVDRKYFEFPARLSEWYVIPRVSRNSVLEHKIRVTLITE